MIRFLIHRGVKPVWHAWSTLEEVLEQIIYPGRSS